MFLERPRPNKGGAKVTLTPPPPPPPTEPRSGPRVAAPQDPRVEGPPPRRQEKRKCMDPELRGRRAHRAGGSAQQRSLGSRKSGAARRGCAPCPANYLGHITRQRRPLESARPRDSARRDVSVYAPPLHPPALSAVLTAHALPKSPDRGRVKIPKTAGRDNSIWLGHLLCC